MQVDPFLISDKQVNHTFDESVLDNQRAGWNHNQTSLRHLPRA
jgi:hypothetical protein